MVNNIVKELKMKYPLEFDDYQRKTINDVYPVSCDDINSLRVSNKTKCK